MRFLGTSALLFLLLALATLVARAVFPPGVDIPIILPLLIVAAAEAQESALQPWRTVFVIALIGGLAMETGSAVAPGLLLGSAVALSLLASAASRVLLAPATLRRRLLLVGAAIPAERLVLLLLSDPGTLWRAPHGLFQAVMMLVIIPALFGILSGAVWLFLLRRPLLRAALRPLFAREA